MASTECDPFLAELKSSIEAGVYESVYSYLHQFREPHQTKEQLCSLSDEFRGFLTSGLEIILAQIKDATKLEKKVGNELFGVFQFFVQCFEVISPVILDPMVVLEKKYVLAWYSVQWQRLEEAEREVLWVLDSLKKIQPSNSNRYLPDVVLQQGKEPVERFERWVADTVLLMMHCVSNRKTKDPEQYRLLCFIANEFQPWIRLFDENIRDHLHNSQAIYLGECTAFLVEHVSPFESKVSLVRNFCNIIMKSSDKDRLLKIILAKPLIKLKSHVDKSSVEMISYFISSEWIQHSHLMQLSAFLYELGVHLHKSKESIQASDALKLHCQATCVILQGKLKQTEADLSNNDISEIFKTWCEGCSFLFQVLSESDRSHEVQTAIKDILGNWAEILSERLPSPMSVVTQWVEDIVKRRKDVDAEGTDLLGTLLSFSSKVSRKKILQQELLCYVQMQNENPKFCQTMQMKIKTKLQEDGSGTPISWLEEARCLRLLGIQSSKYCVQYLSQAIEVSSRHQLALVYCLRALCIEEEEPNSEKVFHDIQSALHVWSDMGIPTSDDFMPENTMLLLYNIIDLLSIKGRVDFHLDIYKVLITIYTWKKVPLCKCLAKLWESRRISHALCPSPIMGAFVNLSNEFDENLDSTQYWMDCLRESQALVVGFRNNFSFPRGPSNDEISSPSYITVNKVKEVASEVISRVSVSSGSGSAYVAGYIYYDLCERLISNGHIVEALPYAMEAHRLRVELFKQKFPTAFEGPSEKYGKTGDNVLVHIQVGSELWSFDASPCDLEICYLSPWNALQCYLESILQVGVIHEILGNGAVAETFLKRGKHLSSSNSLTLFEIVFSSCLGNVYHKKQHWALAKEELQSAKKLLKASVKDISCSKCRVLLEVTIEHNLGDLYLSPYRETESTSLKELPTDLYKPALAKLHTDEWKNSFSFPEERDGTTAVQDSQQLKVSIESDCPESLSKKELLWDLESCVVSIGCDVTCICKTMSCWHCLTAKVMESGSLGDFLKWKWEVVRRRISLKLFTGLGKCLENDGQIHEAHEIVYQSISVLVAPNPFCPATESSFLADLMGKEISVERKHINLYDLMGKEIPGDVLSVERAVILYNLCWLSLKALKDRNKDTREMYRALTDIPIPKLVSWLILAFVLCREVPVLFQQVSRLLAIIFSLSSASVLQAPLPSSGEDLGGRHYASYFHQASLGTQINYHFLTKEVQDRGNTKGSHVPGSIDLASEAQNLPRFVPESIQDFNDFVKHFFKDLPCTTVVCISLLGTSYTSLLHELLSCSRAPAWIMVSRLNSKSHPINILLPVHSVPGDSHDVTNSGKSDGGLWHCPWGFSVVDDVAPAFRSIMEENKKLMYESRLVEAEQMKSIYRRETKIDDRLRKFLKNLEDSWFGSALKFVLLGEWSNCNDLDTLCENLVKDLKSEFFDIDLSLLKLFLGGSKFGFTVGTKQVAQFCCNKGCYVGKVGYEDEITNGAEKLSKFASKLHEAAMKVEALECGIIEPLILVPDLEVQMLPWENLPLLKKQVVYRMPSVWLISVLYKKGGKIDPLDSYYLLNGGGDLKIRRAFEPLLRHHKLKGTFGSAPPAEEIAAALLSHDLFIYIGHGDGSQYITYDRIERLHNCAAALLMGCDSGVLDLYGYYVPTGAPLSYLLAGSPVILANLWAVRGNDACESAYVLLDCWFKERSFGISGNRKSMLGSLMNQARFASRLPYLSGAALVCYGIPTDTGFK